LVLRAIQDSVETRATTFAARRREARKILDDYLRVVSGRQSNNRVSGNVYCLVGGMTSCRAGKGFTLPLELLVLSFDRSLDHTQVHAIDILTFNHAAVLIDDSE
jgi:hypothetical protein